MELTFKLQANRIAHRLLFIILGLIFLSIISRVLLFHFPQIPGLSALASKVYLDEEANFPALYSTLAIGFSAFLLQIIARLESHHQSPTARSWRTLSWIFCALALDELLSFHELFIQPFNRLGFGGFFHYAWVVPGIGAIGIFGLWSIQFLRQLPRPIRQRLMLSGGIFILGALGFEMLDGKVVSQLGETGVLFDPLYQCLMTSEEGLEKLAIVLFIHTLLRYLNQYHGLYELRLRMGEVSTTAPSDLSIRS